MNTPPTAQERSTDDRDSLSDLVPDLPPLSLETLKQQVAERPGAALAVAACAGVLVGWFIKRV